MAEGAGEFSGEPAVTGPVVTAVAGSSFCVSGRSGDLDARAVQGLFFQDTRILSRWRLRVDGEPPQVLDARSAEPYSVLFVARVPPPDASTELLVERRRYVGDGMREDVRLRNLSPQDLEVTVVVEVDADFADLFEVKEGRVRDGLDGTVARTAEGNALLLVTHQGQGTRGVRVVAEGATAARDRLVLPARVPARGEWNATLSVHPVVDGQEVQGTFPAGVPVEHSAPARRLADWRSSSPRVQTSYADLGRTLRRSLDDLGALRIFDPAHPDRAAVAAGAPWFMALFGRDSLLSASMALPLDPGLALGTLRALAQEQGRKVDPLTEEEPGRILHETRLGADFPLARGGGRVYYGSADATPLFVVLLGEVARWGAPSDDVRALLPHADRALEWVERHGDPDGDGFVEYARKTPHGLRNQGWKDSHDGVTFADGTLAEPPIALCEVQGYAYAAYLARADLAEAAQEDPAPWRARAARLQEQFEERFWLPDRGWYALALDGDKRPVDALASNMGHCLWSGIVPPERAAQVAEHLLSPELFSGWGVRTLATSMGAYNPMSYHNGSVWPHDNALAAAGLMRYGLVEQAQRVAMAVMDAAGELGGRLPELFCGFAREDYSSPLPYPTSCSPQAWASAAPVSLLRTLLRLDPDLPRGEVRFAPAWPQAYGPVAISALQLGGRSAHVTVADGTATLTGLPDGVRVLASAPAGAAGTAGTAGTATMGA